MAAEKRKPAKRGKFGVTGIFRASTEQWAAYRAEAERVGLPVNTWMRVALDSYLRARKENK